MPPIVLYGRSLFARNPLSLPHAVPQQLTARLGSEPEDTQHHLVVFFGAEIHILEELLGLLVDLLLLVICSKTFFSSLTLRKNKLECFLHLQLFFPVQLW